MTIERKILPLVEAKAPTADGPGSIEGYASVFGGVDSYGDTIDRGAYADTISDFLRDGFIAWSHDWANPVATPAAAHEDGKGLYIVANFHTHADAQRARIIAAERLERGLSMGLSIGYETLESESRTIAEPYRTPWGEYTDKVRVLKKIKLYEVSLVTVPADSAALATDVKGFGLSFEDHSERVRVAVQEYLERSRSGSELRTKEGRAISSARRTRMESVSASLRSGADEIDALLVETAPPPKTDARAATETLRLQITTERTRARARLSRLGITIQGASV